MRVDLIELLRTREIAHPSRLVSFKSQCDGAVQIEVAGHPWWLGQPYTGEQNARITFHFDRLKEGDLGIDAFCDGGHNEDLEVFNATPLSDAKWNKGVYCQILCNAPVQDPMAVYVALDDYLEADRCPRHPFEFFNSETMGGFLKMTRETSFLLCAGPEAICGVVGDALSKQQADFRVIRGDHRESEDGVLVDLGSARFVCAQAYAVFD